MTDLPHASAANRRMRLLAIAGLLLLLAGCASAPEPRVMPTLETGQPAVPPGEMADASAESDEEDARVAPTIFPGNDQLVRLPPVRETVEVQGDRVALNFERAPLEEVVHAILGDLLKLDYSVDQPLQGEVTLYTRAPVARDQLLAILETVLQANGAMMVRGRDGLFHLGSGEAMRSLADSPRRPGNLEAGHGVVIVPLQHVGAAEMADILRPVAPGSAILRVDSLRNLLMLAGSRSQIEGWLELIESFDIDLMAGMSVGIFPLNHASVAEVDSALRMLMRGGGSGTTAGAESGGAQDGESDQEAGQALAPLPAAVPKGDTLPGLGAVRIMPVERLNSLLVVSPRKQAVETLGEWIERLDQPPDNDIEPQMFVYPVQNGTAPHLADMLTALFSGQRRESTRQPDSGVAPRLEKADIGSGAAAAAEDQSDRPAVASEIAPDVRVVADEHNNALIIYAPRREYRKIERALRKLDQAPTQVLIEASIVEVTLTDEIKYGLEWYLEQGLGSGWRGNAALDVGTASGSGFSYTVTNPAGALRAVLNALADKSLLNVISTPSVMVLDNHTAMIHVGDQQPVQTATTVTDGGNTTTSIQYKDTGVMLAVTPSVNAGGLVSMVIEQEVTDVGPVDEATGQRAFLQRQIHSRVAVRSGETVVLGGLIRDNSTRSRQGIPVLHDLPVVGNLFGTTNDSSNRTELLVMIVPRVIRSEQDLRELTDEMRGRMQSLRLDLMEREGPGRAAAEDEASRAAP